MNSIIVSVCGVVLTVLAVNAFHHDNKSYKFKISIITTITTSNLPFNFDNNCTNLTVYFTNLSSFVKYKILYKADEKERKKGLKWTEDESKKCFSIVKKDKAIVKKDKEEKKHKLTSIYLEMKSEADWCKNIMIFEDGPANRNQSADSEYEYNEECFSFPTCTIEVDLKNEFIDSFTKKPQTEATITTASNTPSTGQQSKQPPVAVLTYVIITVIVVCFTILVIYLCVKKYCHRNSEPIEAIELNTYGITNEVLYADLSLTHGDSQPPRHEEEATYAKIIGVMKPVDGNVKDK